MKGAVMDFRLSDEQVMLRQASRRLLETRSSPVVVRQLIDTATDLQDGPDAALWSAGAEMGWLALAVPESFGGSGQGLVELAIVAEQIGRASARGPFLPSMLVGLAVARYGDDELRRELLPTLAAGSVAASWAFAEPHRPWSLEGLAAAAVDDDGDVLISGTKTLVQDAAAASYLLVSAVHDEVVQTFLVDRDAPGLTVRRQRVLDLTRSFYEVRLDAVRVSPQRRLEMTIDDHERLLDVGAVLTCAESLGMSDRLLEMTVDYAKVRVQFGRPIGSFQAVKHHCADMRIRTHGIRAGTYLAAMIADATGDPVEAARAASSAKAYVSQAASDLAGDALQVHGGIGFTWEHDLHLYLKRIKTNEVLYGTIAVHQERLCRILLAAAILPARAGRADRSR